MALIQQIKHGINLKYGVPSKFSKNEIRIRKASVEIQTNTSVFYTTPHISWTAYYDTLWPVNLKKKKEVLQMNITTCVWCVFKKNYYKSKWIKASFYLKNLLSTLHIV